jgi:hypothetical protein
LPSEFEERRLPAIDVGPDHDPLEPPELPDELIDELLAGAHTPEEITGPDGLLQRLTKRLVERAMDAELTVWGVQILSCLQIARFVMSEFVHLMRVAAFALDPDDEAAPVLRVRVLAEPVVDAVDDLVELAVREGPDEDHAGVLATRF